MWRALLLARLRLSGIGVAVRRQFAQQIKKRDLFRRIEWLQGCFRYRYRMWDNICQQRTPFIVQFGDDATAINPIVGE